MFLFAGRATRLLRAGILRMLLVAIVASCPQTQILENEGLKSSLQRPGDIKGLE